MGGGVRGAVVVLVLLVALQLVPYGRHRAGPLVVAPDPAPRAIAEPAWDSSRTRELAVRACYSCHSNEAEWPWYASVAPVSWLVQWEVDRARAAFNFSEGARGAKGGEDIGYDVPRHLMPPDLHLFVHPEAQMTSAEKRALVMGLRATLEGMPARR